ncbi:MAG: hypothetical protein ACTSRH_01995 [Promethearchaeota archaeon]
MNLLNPKIDKQISPNISSKKVKIICPTCKKEKTLDISDFMLNTAKNINTISIPKGLICEHHFQAFIDKNLKVRGYQKVDFEIALDFLREKKKKQLEFIEKEKNDASTSKSKPPVKILIDDNVIEYGIDDHDNLDNETNKVKFFYIKEEIIAKKNASEERYNPTEEKMDINEIYNEFWEFIDHDIPEFKSLIEKDPRRKNTSLNK